MKLLIITNLFPNAAEPTRGLYSLQQAQALARLADVTVIAPVPWHPPLPRWQCFARWRTSVQIPKMEVVHGMRVFHPRYFVVPKVGRWLDAVSFAWGIRPTVARLAKERGVDAVFATWAYPDVVGTVRLAKILNAPIVAAVLGSDINLYAEGWRGRRISNALRHCRAVVCVAEALHKKVKALGVPSETLHVVPNGVDLERFQIQSRSACRGTLGLQADRSLILFVGHLVPVKGADVLLEAFARLCRDIARPKRPLLALVGEGEQAAALAQRVRELGLEADVRFIGAQPHERVSVWLGACDVLSIPSRQEGCPNVVLEALACGRPVVGTRTGGIPELVNEGSCGLLVPAETPDALATALREALTRQWDPAVIRASVRGGWEANAATILKLFGVSREPDRGPTILHVLRYSIPNMSGYTVRSQALIEGQRALGAHPVVVTSSRHESPIGVETIAGIRYYRCRLSSRSWLRWFQTQAPIARTIVTMAQLCWRIIDVARAQGAQIIHAHSPVMCGFPALLAARWLRLPFVYEVRALWEDAAVDQEKTTEGSGAYRLSRWLETMVLRRADRIVVICEGLKRELIARGLPAGRIALSPNGVDPDLFTPLAGKDPQLVQRYGLEGRKVVGFIGSFFHFEGLEFLLRAMPALVRREPSIRLMIVGGGEHEQALRQLTNTMGLNNSVIFTGRVPHAEVRAYYSVMDALVYPRLSRRITELVTPLKPLEAMALGRPVLASDVGGLRELVRDDNTGLLFRAEDPNSLADACARLVQSPDLARRLTEQAHMFIRSERTWTKICAGNVRLYREMLGDAV